MISARVRETGCRWPTAGARPGRVTSTRSFPSFAARSFSRISARRVSKADSSEPRAALAAAPIRFFSSTGREATVFRISETAPFFPKYRPLTSRRSLSVLADSIARSPASESSLTRSVASVKPKRPLCDRGPGRLRQCLESRRVVDREVRQRLPVDFDPGFFQPEHELAVGEPVLPGGGVDPHDPEGADLPLLVPPVAVGVLERARDRFLRRPQQLAAAPAEALGGLQDLAALLVGMDCSFYAWHRFIPLPLWVFLEIRQQAADRLLVRGVHERFYLQAPLPLPALGGEDVALPRLGPLDPAASGRLEALVRAPVRRHLRHFYPSCFSAGLGEGRPTGFFLCATGATTIIIVFPSIFAGDSTLDRSPIASMTCFRISNPLWEA